MMSFFCMCRVHGTEKEVSIFHCRALLYSSCLTFSWSKDDSGGFTDPMSGAEKDTMFCRTVKFGLFPHSELQYFFLSLPHFCTCYFF